MTIRDYCLALFNAGADADTAWRSAQQEFPFKTVSWGYVRRLKRDHDDLQRAMLGEGMAV